MAYRTVPFQARKVTGGWSLYSPSTTTTDDLTIYANLTDTTPSIVLQGTTDVLLNAGAAGYVRVYRGAGIGPIFWNNGTTSFIAGDNTAGHGLELQCNYSDINGDIYLRTGTGVVKFGAYTAGAATDSTGYITIKDAAGNTRKLMVQA